MRTKEDERCAGLLLHYRILMSILHAKLKTLNDEFTIREKIRELEGRT